MARIPGNTTGGRPLFLRESGQTELTEASAERGSNVPEVSVSELSAALKRTVEDRFGFVRLRGEISNYRGPHGSGHAYFCLKDEGARIDAVVWKTTLARIRIKPEEGLEVIASGKITTFPGKSSYQIVVESLEPAGVGALMALLEERRLRLAAEGLFDTARKKALPYLPGVIGVITSPTGSVIRDILHRVAARFRRHVVIWPVRVQGETSAVEVAAAILGFNAHGAESPFRRPDLIIVARGGGSLEDLWGFNDEAVVRAVAGSLIPLISAVGHETDWTLIDHAADLRAPTPTGAAELAVPVHAELTEMLDRLRRRQANAALREIDRAQQALRNLVRLMPSSAADLLATPRQRFDRADGQLPSTVRALHDRTGLVLARLGQRLRAQSPQARMARAEQRLIAAGNQFRRAGAVAAERRRSRVATLKDRLAAGFAGQVRLAIAAQDTQRGRLHNVAGRLHRARGAAVSRESARIAGLGQLLASLSYRSVLARGYAIVHAEDGATLRSVSAVTEAGRVVIELVDGRVAAQIGTGPVDPASRSGFAGRNRGFGERPRASRPNRDEGAQPTLFDP